MDKSRIKVKGDKETVEKAVSIFTAEFNYEVERKISKSWSWRKFKFLYKAILKEKSKTDEEIKEVINKISDKCNNQNN